MKRSTLIILIGAFVFIALLVFSWVFVRISGILNTYEITSTANEPSLLVGKNIFTSNKKDPKRFDFIAYKNDGITVLHRLCGLPGDTLQLIEGKLFVNNKPSLSIPTKHNYLITEVELDLLKSKYPEVSNELITPQVSRYLISLADNMAIENGISNKRVISKNGIREQYVGEQWNNDYNLDNFGPVIVPNECYFVLGDNRHYSADSRYIGFVHKSKYVGTVIDTW